MNKALVAAVGLCGALAFGAPANAYIEIVNGPAVANVPGGSGVNDLFVPNYGAVPQKGYIFGDTSGDGSAYQSGYLSLSTKSVVDFSYLGSEAGYHNAFQLFLNGAWTSLGPISSVTGAANTTPGFSGGGNSGSYDNPGAAGATPLPGAANSVTPLAIGSYTLDAGLIPFRFYTASASKTATNAMTNDSMSYSDGTSIAALFLSGGSPSDKLTQSDVVDVWYDDSGANVDDNHDDMGIRMSATPVPVPAALPIIGAALAGFGFAGWRRRAA